MCAKDSGVGEEGDDNNNKTACYLESKSLSFEKDGYLVLPNAIPPSKLKKWREFAAAYFEECFQQLHKAGHTAFPVHQRRQDKQYAMGLGVKHGFREIVMRSQGRYEMSLLHGSPHNQASAPPPIDEIQQCLHPLVPHLLGASQWDEITMCHLSLVVSTPGASEQSWHADGGHVSMSEHLPCHVANVFIPLQDVPPELGPTEFRPGTHVYTRNLAPMMLGARARKELRAPVAPDLKLGDVLIFDYRVLHRGKANRSSNDNRPILVLTFSKPWYKDVCNFPKRSMYEPATTKEAQAERQTDRDRGRG